MSVVPKAPPTVTNGPWDPAYDLGPAFCPCCRTWLPAMRPVPKFERACTACKSLERHRFLTPLLQAMGADGVGIAGVRALDGSSTVVDIAPSPILTEVLGDLPGRTVRFDFDPAADGRIVDVRASLTHLPLPDDSADVLLCSHVLEHIPDDAAAMNEITRVLKPEGIGFVLVPIVRGKLTDEDPTVGPEEAKVRFGQADHVRMYGDDFVDRLAKAGLQYVDLTVAEFVDAPDVMRALRLGGGERMWLVRPVEGPALPGAGELATALRAELLKALISVGRPQQAAPKAAAKPAARPAGAAKPRQAPRPVPETLPQQVYADVRRVVGRGLRMAQRAARRRQAARRG